MCQSIEKTCIVQNSIGEYYIAKNFYATDTYALNEVVEVRFR